MISKFSKDYLKNFSCFQNIGFLDLKKTTISYNIYIIL